MDIQREVFILHVVTPSQMRQIDNRAIQEFKIPGIVLMENAAIQSVNVIKGRYPAAPYPKVLILAGVGNNGGDGFAVARHLYLMGYGVTVMIISRNGKKPSGDASTNLEIIKNLSSSLIREPIESVESFDSWSKPLNIIWLEQADVQASFVYRNVVDGHGHILVQDQTQDSAGVQAQSLGKRTAQIRQIIEEASLIVDSLFGTGLDRPVTGIFADIINEVNKSGKPVVAIDIPSGINGEDGQIQGTAIRAADTVTFGYLKMGHLIYPGREYSGNVHLKSIGLPLDSADSVSAAAFTLDDSEAARMLKNRPRDGHKGTFGKVAVIAGSTGLTGAAHMTSIAALRSGAGLVTLGIPASLNPIMEEKLTEVMTFPLEDQGQGHMISESLEDVKELLEDKDVLAIGPGCGKNPGVFEILRNILGTIHISIVIDADGLNHISRDMNLIKNHPAPVILTPHPGEMSRLTGIALQDVLKRPIEIAAETARKYNAVVLLKGAASVAADPDGRIYINRSGNSGMGKGGSGDVLTGMIASLVAQGYKPYDAAVLGCYIHGRAGDEAASQAGEVGLIAGDIIEAIPRTFKKLYEIRDGS